MNPLDELRRAIWQAPDDEGPRRVLADALVERGDPRGEFLALHLDPTLDADTRDLRTRALWQRHGARWLEEDLGPHDEPWTGLTFKRGFLTGVYLSVDELAALDARLARQPVLSLRATGLTADLAAVEASALLPRVHRLGLEYDLDDVSEDALSRVLDRAVNVRSLILGARRDAPHCWRSLERWPGLSRLEHLELDSVTLSAERASWLARACPKLASLKLRRAADDAALLALGELPLRSLFMAETGVLADALGRGLIELSLVHCPVRGRLQLPATLESLELYASAEPDVVAALDLPRLKRLDVTGCKLSDLASLARLSTLEELRCSENPLSGSTVPALIEALPRLRTLDVGDSSVGDDGALAIAAHPHSRSLRSLGLSRCGLTARGVEALATSEQLTALRTLNVTANDTARAPIAALAAAPFDAMEALHVAGNVRRGSEAIFEDGWLPADGTTATSEVWQRKLELDGSAMPRRKTQSSGHAPSNVKSFEPSAEYAAGDWVKVPLQGAGVVTAVHPLYVEARFDTGVMRLPVVVKGAKPYDAQHRYAAGDLLQHPTLGAGRVESATHDRIEVAFGAHGLKKLVHARR